jgi:FkbM family methyltransferase
VSTDPNDSVGARIKRLGERLWYSRGAAPLLRLPVPWRLPYGAWFMAHADAMGARVVGYHLAGHPYEEPQWKFVERSLRAGMVVVDIGANQGFYTLLASKCVGTRGRVYAFEPAPTERRKLERNLRLNGCANVVVEPLAVGASAGTAPFHAVAGHQGSWSSLREPASDVTVPSRLISVTMITLDEYVVDHNLMRLDMIKIDTEGGELDVLIGAQDAIRKHEPIILCEVEGRRTRQWGYSPAAIVKYLTDRGYQWFELSDDGKASPAELAEEGLWRNLLAIPLSKLASTLS